jgi:hypothetical protein
LFQFPQSKLSAGDHPFRFDVSEVLAYMIRYVPGSRVAVKTGPEFGEAAALQDHSVLVRRHKRQQQPQIVDVQKRAYCDMARR